MIEPSAILALISNLMQQIIILNQENTVLKEELNKLSNTE
jgi:hypothetical protein